MKMNLILISVILAFSGQIIAEDATPESASESVLTVRVRNGTEGGIVAEGSPVIVTFYRDRQQIKQLTAATDAEGDCVLSGVPSGAGLVAVAQAKHSDMLFSSSPLRLTQDHLLGKPPTQARIHNGTYNSRFPSGLQRFRSHQTR